MAGLSFEIPKELTEQLQKHLKNFDDIAPKMLEEAAPIVVKKVKEKTPVKTGQLRDSVCACDPKKTKNGAWILPITFTGENLKQLKSGEYEETPNIIVAVSTEYGTSKEPAQPFIRPAVAECEDEVVDKMQEVFNREANQ